MIAEEYTSQEIAEKLSLSLLQKLQVKNSIGLVRTPMQLGLIE